MAGTLTISTLSDGTNSTSSTNCIQGSAKAWVSWVGTSGTINASYNVSSVTRSGTGVYTLNFTNALSDANYAVAGWGRYTSSTNRIIVCATSASSTLTTTQLGILVGDYSSPLDVQTVSVAVFR
jgi:hypothetical protein